MIRQRHTVCCQVVAGCFIAAWVLVATTTAAAQPLGTDSETWVADEAMFQDDAAGRLGERGLLRSEYSEQFWGFVSADLRSRTHGDEDDLDGTGGALINYGDPEVDGVSATVFLRTIFDLDGNGDDGGTLPSASAGYDSDARLLPYLVYVNLQDDTQRYRARAGRQELASRPGTVFDGATVEGVFERIWLARVYLGIPYYPYGEYDSEDLLIGALGAWVPTNRNYKAELEGTFVSDHSFGLGTREDFRLTVRGDYLSDDDKFSAHGEASWLNDGFQELRLRGEYRMPKFGLAVRGAYTGSFTEYTDTTTEFGTFIAVLGVFAPYQRLQASATWTFYGANARRDGESYSVTPGVDGRFLADDDDSGLFNHGYFRVFGTLSGNNIAEVVGLFGDVTLNYFDADGDMEFYALTGEVGYEQRKVFRVSVGSAYDLYRYDRITLDEQEKVYTIFLRGRYWVYETFELHLGYEFQDVDDDPYHTVEFGFMFPF